MLDSLLGRQRQGYYQQPPAPFMPFQQMQQPPLPPYQQAQQPQFIQQGISGQMPIPQQQVKIPKKPRPQPQQFQQPQQPQQFQQPQFVQQEIPPGSIDIRQAAVEVLRIAGKLKLVCLIAIVGLIVSSFIAVISSMVGAAIALSVTGVIAYFMVLNERESNGLRRKYGV